MTAMQRDQRLRANAHYEKDPVAKLGLKIRNYRFTIHRKAKTKKQSDLFAGDVLQKKTT